MNLQMQELVMTICICRPYLCPAMHSSELQRVHFLLGKVNLICCLSSSSFGSVVEGGHYSVVNGYHAFKIKCFSSHRFESDLWS